MDTSTSQRKRGQKILNAAEIVFDRHAGVIHRINEISPEIFLELIALCVKKLKPYLSYINGLRTIEKIIADEHWDGSSITYKMDSYDLGDLPSFRGFLIHREWLKRDETNHFGGECLNLILSEKGEWFAWKIKIYFDKDDSPFRCRTLELSMFSLKNFLQLLKTYATSGSHVLQGLYLLLGYDKLVTEKRQAKKESIRQKIGIIIGRDDIGVVL